MTIYRHNVWLYVSSLLGDFSSRTKLHTPIDYRRSTLSGVSSFGVENPVPVREQLLLESVPDSFLFQIDKDGLHSEEITTMNDI